MEAVRPEIMGKVEWFAMLMKRKLMNPKNVNKGGWIHMSFQEMFNRLDDEYFELLTELETYKRPYEIIQECCDIANFAMMIADKAYQSTSTPAGVETDKKKKVDNVQSVTPDLPLS